MPSRSDPGNGSASGLDQGMRDRVKQQIERFDKALDAAMAASTPEALDELS